MADTSQERQTLDEQLDRVLIALAHTGLAVALLPIFVAALHYTTPPQAVVDWTVAAYTAAVTAYSIVAFRDVLTFGRNLLLEARSRASDYRDRAVTDGGER